MEELLEILEELHPDVDFENNKRLIDDHLLDSFDIITLLQKLVMSLIFKFLQNILYLKTLIQQSLYIN